jgi:hypothetical protein
MRRQTMNSKAKKVGEDLCAMNNGDIPSESHELAGNIKRMTQLDFNQTCREWIAEQNRNFERYGLWCDGLRAW